MTKDDMEGFLKTLRFLHSSLRCGKARYAVILHWSIEEDKRLMVSVHIPILHLTLKDRYLIDLEYLRKEEHSYTRVTMLALQYTIRTLKENYE